jgi:hypothetical protein
LQRNIIVLSTSPSLKLWTRTSFMYVVSYIHIDICIVLSDASCYQIKVCPNSICLSSKLVNLPTIPGSCVVYFYVPPVRFSIDFMLLPYDFQSFLCSGVQIFNCFYFLLVTQTSIIIIHHALCISTRLISNRCVISKYINIRETKGEIKNRQSRETGNIWYTRRREIKPKKHSIIYVGHHYTQTRLSSLD